MHCFGVFCSFTCTVDVYRKGVVGQVMLNAPICYVYSAYTTCYVTSRYTAGRKYFTGSINLWCIHNSYRYVMYQFPADISLTYTRGHPYIPYKVFFVCGFIYTCTVYVTTERCRAHNIFSCGFIKNIISRLHRCPGYMKNNKCRITV